MLADDFKAELDRRADETSAVPECPVCRLHPVIGYVNGRCDMIRHTCHEYSVIISGEDPAQRWRAVCLMLTLYAKGSS